MSAVQSVFQTSSRRTLQSLQILRSSCLCTSSYNSKVNEKKYHTTTYRQAQSSSTTKRKILSQSSILVQDGMGFEELPILMRRATKDSFPFTPYSYAGNSVKEESEFDLSFRRSLQNCSSVTSVFKLLEVPHNQVEGYSSAFALQRLHELKSSNTDWYRIHSFIRSAVMRELYDRVQQDVKLLSSETLLSLVECYLEAEGFSLTCLDAINEEIQVRLADNAFTIPELLALAKILKENKSLVHKPKPEAVEDTTKSSDFVSHTLSTFLPNSEVHREETEQGENPQHFDQFSAKESVEVRGQIFAKCQELLDNIWVHLVSRYPDVNEHTLPMVLDALTLDQRSVVPLLERPTANVWAELSPQNVTSILNNLCRLRVHNAGVMSYLGRWAYVHIHRLNRDLLLSFLHTFTKFWYLDENLIKVLEKYLQIKTDQAELDVVSMSVEYCTTCHFLSPIILDAAAAHLTQHGHTYEPLQLYAIVRAYGYLNHLPASASNFLKKTEECLWSQFDNLQEHQVLEVLGSLTFINVLPKNFYNRVTSADFYTRVGALTNPSKASALMWLRVLKQAVALDLSTDVKSNLDWVLAQRNRRSVFLYLDSHRVAVTAMREALDAVVGPKCNHVLPFYGCCAIYLDKNQMPLEVYRNKTEGVKILGKVHKKLVLMLRSADHFTVNTRQLLGAQAQRARNLAKLGFTIVEVRASHLFFHEDSLNVLQELLLPHIDLDKVIEVRLQDDPSQASLDMTLDRDWLSYNAEESVISDDDGDGID